MLVSGTLKAFFSLYNILISKREPGIISEFSLLTNPNYKMPTVLPDGTYRH